MQPFCSTQDNVFAWWLCPLLCNGFCCEFVVAVIITGMIPACMHAETAFAAPWWIIMPANPIKVNEDSISTFKGPTTLAFHGIASR
jgi:hypothetical protein